VLIIGSNTAESHPVLAIASTRTTVAGQKLIVSDLRENEMAQRADIFCIRARHGLIWLSAITKYIWTNGLETRRSSDQYGQRRRGVQEEPGVLTLEMASERCELSDRNRCPGRAHDRGSRGRLHPLGDWE